MPAAPNNDAQDKTNAQDDRVPVGFVQVFKKELEIINERRARLREGATKHIHPTQPDVHSNGATPPDPFPPLPTSGTFGPTNPVLNAVGLCLSGGGVRSAAFCLGSLQAMHKAGVLNRVDYLSTVSGGGYIGASLTAALSVSDGFPFCDTKDESDPPAVRHIRNYTRYLMPNGKTDLLASLVIYLRGLVANTILILPWLVIAAYITVRSNPTQAHLSEPDFFRVRIHDYPPFRHLELPFYHFNLTIYLALLLVLLIAGWALRRSFRSQLHKQEVPSTPTSFFGWTLVFLLVVAFFELQPFVLEKIWADRAAKIVSWAGTITTWMQGAAIVLAPVTGVAALFKNQLQAQSKRLLEAPGKVNKAAGYISKALLYLFAATVPLILWAVYFQLSWWGISSCSGQSSCTFPVGFDHSPGWLRSVADAMFSGWTHPVASFYCAAFVFLLSLSLLLRPNANSLHRLYRDRLSKAFLFDPNQPISRPASGLRAGWDRLRQFLLSLPPEWSPPTELRPVGETKLSELREGHGPYHILNTALNIQGSKAVNQRGRNADFFMLSHAYTGSEATGYVKTAAMEAVMPELDLGTAMAISGAAASPGMGSQTIGALTPTMAALNVRVGFWLRNPRFVGGVGSKMARLREFLSLYFLYELIANLSETSWNVYVTDGGHLENLGAYELLKRRCRVIIVVDAESDPEMTFASFVTLQRYARIDLGVRINLPWERIRNRTHQVSRDFGESGTTQPRAGPHCAIGQISYPDGGRGQIIYIKASLTGDENDYILDYKNRYPMFPHESTGDQFFSEEQFEGYRALGFHATGGLFDRRDQFAHTARHASPHVETDLHSLDTLFPTLAPSDPFRPRKYKSFFEVLAATESDGFPAAKVAQPAATAPAGEVAANRCEEDSTTV